MKSLKFKRLQINESDFLSKGQMKRITGGYSGMCVPDGTICWTEGGTNYTCFQIGGSGDEDCCCGHDSGNENCWGA